MGDCLLRIGQPGPGPHPEPDCEQVDAVGEVRALECHVVLILERTAAAPRPAAVEVSSADATKPSSEVTMGGSLEM